MRPRMLSELSRARFGVLGLELVKLEGPASFREFCDW